MKSADLNFTDVTTAALVAGREAVIATTAGELETLFSRADALGLVVCLCTDVSRELADDEPIECGAVIGVLVASVAHPEPGEVDRAALDAALTRAKALDWGQVHRKLGLSSEALITPPDALWLTATGPLAGGLLAHGVPASYDETRDTEWAEGSAQAREPTLEFTSGKDSDQRALTDGIWGKRLAYVGDWATADVTAAVRAPGALGSLTGEARLWLMASYG